MRRILHLVNLRGRLVLDVLLSDNGTYSYSVFSPHARVTASGACLSRADMRKVIAEVAATNRSARVVADDDAAAALLKEN